MSLDTQGYALPGGMDDNDSSCRTYSCLDPSPDVSNLQERELYAGVACACVGHGDLLSANVRSKNSSVAISLPTAMIAVCTGVSVSGATAMFSCDITFTLFDV